MRRRYFYVDEGNEFMRQARRVAEERSLDRDWPTGVVVVSAKGRRVIGRGWNGSEYHRQYGCRRKELGIKTGERYDLCEGCGPRHHAEARAIGELKVKSEKLKIKGTEGLSLYLWGHWWCCESCWQVMIDAGVKNVYLVEGADVRFNQVRNSSAN